MLMIASAAGDPSNVDLLSLGEIYADWRLVPHDNNVGQRNVNLVPAGGGADGIIASLQGKGFWLGNPSRKTALMAVTIALPSVLVRAGWRVRLASFPDGGLRMKPGERRLVAFDLQAGGAIAKAEVAAAAERDIVIGHLDGIVAMPQASGLRRGRPAASAPCCTSRSTCRRLSTVGDLDHAKP